MVRCVENISVEDERSISTNKKEIHILKKEKKENYQLNASLHTLEVKSEYPTIQNEKNDYITTRISQDGKIGTSKINPNKYDGDIFSFTEFEETMENILSESQIDEYRITRANLRLDNYSRSHYKAYAKLNKYIISALMVTYKVKNKYRTVDLVTGDQLTIAIKNDYFEIENYDRNVKNKVTGNTTEPAKARLEERTMAKQWRKIRGGLVYTGNEENLELLKEEFTTGWEERWKKAKSNLKLVQEVYNEALQKKYYDGLNARPVQFRTLTDFLIQNQDSIFTSMQMVDLLKRLGVSNPESRAKYHKKKYGIEYFSQSDVEYAIKEIKRATQQYFSS